MRMTLAPGEVFEHAHSGDSVTTLVEGSADLVMGGERTALVVGVPTPIPARVSHVIVNTGPSPAVMDCTHRDITPPGRS